MNNSTAIAALTSKHGFSPSSAANALFLANELGTARFGNLDIESHGNGAYSRNHAQPVDWDSIAEQSLTGVRL